MTAAPPAGAAAVARRRGEEEEEKGEEKEEEEQRSPRPRRRERSEKDTARRPALFQWSLPFAARSGGGLGQGPQRTLGLFRPPLRGHTPLGAGATGGGPEWAKVAPLAWSGGRLLQGRP